MLNSPRTLVGASGLGSKVSWWLVPPSVQMRMQLTSLLFLPAAAAACRPLQYLSPAWAEVEIEPLKNGETRSYEYRLEVGGWFMKRGHLTRIA